MNSLQAFPIYRKYSGIEVWFKITSDKDFLEVKKIGNKILVSEVKAVQFPEIQFIQDMINLYEDRWQVAQMESVEVLLAEKNHKKNPR